MVRAGFIWPQKQQNKEQKKTQVGIVTNLFTHISQLAEVWIVWSGNC